MPNRSTKEKGDEFENEIAGLLQFLPDSSVTQHVKILGKDVDILLEYTDALLDRRKIAIDCKDYRRPLTREAATKEWNDYNPLIVNRAVDSFWLVTRNDIVANAKEVFSDKSSRHFTAEDIQNMIFRPQRLIDDMEKQFSIDSLDKYYIAALGKFVNIKFRSKYFDTMNSDFIKFALSTGNKKFEEAKSFWLKDHPDDKSVVEDLSPTLFSRIIKEHQTDSIVELEPLIDEWIADSTVRESIAILGSYGTGKSSFARRLAWLFARRFKTQETVRMPLLIELKDFSSHQDLRSLITDYLVNRHHLKNYSYELFRALNKEGRFLIILDGFDEMKLGMTQEALLFNFNELNQLCEGLAKVIICGRPTVFASDDEQAAILTGSSRPDLGGTGRYIQLEVAPLNRSEIFELLYGYIKVTNVPNKGRVQAQLKHLEEALEKIAPLRELLSRPVHLPMLVNVLPTWDGVPESLNRASLYERFIQNIITREMGRLLPALRQKYSRDERFTFASSLALAMLNSGELVTIRNSDIPNEVVAPFVRRGETLDIAKRDLVTNCFLERKPPDLLTFGHKSFGEFLAARRLVDIAKEGSLDGAVKRSSLELWQFFNELVPEHVLDTIFENPGGNANSITLILGTEIFEKLTEKLRELPFIRSVIRPVRSVASELGIGSTVILDKAFAGQRIRENWMEDAFENGAVFRERIRLLESVLSDAWLIAALREDALREDALREHALREDALREHAWRREIFPFSSYTILSGGMKIRSEIQTWYLR